jgi:hypothetical protein
VFHDPLKQEKYDRHILKRLQQRHSRESTVKAARPELKRGHCLICKTVFLCGPDRATFERCLECRSPLLGIHSDETPLRAGLKFMTVSFNLPRATFLGVSV